MKQILWFCLVLLTSIKVTALPETKSQYLKFVHPPFVLNGITMVPLRETAVAIGVEVEVNKAKTIILKMPEKQLARLIVKSITTERLFTISDRIHGGDITFLPLRDFANDLFLPFNITGNLLTIGSKTWEVKGKLIVVDRGNQRVSAFDGLNQTFGCRTCTGKPGYTTPTGVFQVYKKISGKHKVVGKPWGGVMYNPVYFSGATALHGSTEMRRKPSSHGCCRLYYKDADWIYKWSAIGTQVYVIP